MASLGTSVGPIREGDLEELIRQDRAFHFTLFAADSDPRRVVIG